MIEIVYEKEKQKSEGNESFFRIPNNIRQIGEVGGTQKIYIEDYAYTYLCRISSENLSRGIGAILLGQANWKEGVSYLFVKSAVALPDMEVSEEHLEFTQEIWNHVYERTRVFSGPGSGRLVPVDSRMLYGASSGYLSDPPGPFWRQ